MQEKQIFQHLVDGDEISWRSIIFDAVKQEAMDPWDINIARIAEHFMVLLKDMKEISLHVPGKVLLASAILLRLKSNKFLDDDVAELDRLIASSDQEESDWEEDDDYSVAVEGAGKEGEPSPTLIPRTPQPRKRKVSVYDLVKALDKALEVKHRRKILSVKPHPTIELPNQLFDLSLVIKDVYTKVIDHHDQHGSIVFQHLVADNREDKVYTFIPLLHLCNMRKIDLHQEEHFGHISIALLSNERQIDDAALSSLERE